MASIQLSLWQKFVLRINGYVLIDWEKSGRWMCPVYLVNCKKHGKSKTIFGLDDEEVCCQLCRKEKTQARVAQARHLS